MVTVRPATVRDYPALRELTFASYVAEGHIAAADPYVTDLTNIATRSEGLYIAEVDGTVAGGVNIAVGGSSLSEVAYDNEVEFRMLAVAPAYRGHGIGRTLVQHVLDTARTQQAAAVVITTMASMTTAQAMYTTMGFHRAPHRDWNLYTAGIVDHQEGLETFLVYVHPLN